MKIRALESLFYGSILHCSIGIRMEKPNKAKSAFGSRLLKKIRSIKSLITISSKSIKMQIPNGDFAFYLLTNHLWLQIKWLLSFNRSDVYVMCKIFYCLPLTHVIRKKGFTHVTCINLTHVNHTTIFVKITIFT